MPYASRERQLEYQRKWAAEKKARLQAERTKRYHERRNEALEQFDGACGECGSEDDLQFDHIDPTTKTLSFCDAFRSVKRDRMEEELEKAQLLCISCHSVKTRRETADIAR